MQNPLPRAKLASLRSTLAEWTVTLLLLLFGTTSLVQAFVIPSGSMENTLLVGDHVLVDKLSYAPPDSISKRLLPYSEVKRGDIIVFRYPLDLKQNYVKRVIGLPGDRLHMVDKQLYLNGKPLREPYAVHKFESIDPYRDNFPAGAPLQALPPRTANMLRDHVVNGDLVVPPGQYFALGDNRDNSEDSRYWGFVPRENIVGKPVVIYWSYDTTTERLMSPGVGIDHIVDLAGHFFTKTRWSRTFRLVRGEQVP